MKLVFSKQGEVDDALELPPIQFENTETGEEKEKVLVFHDTTKMVKVTDRESGKAIGTLWQSTTYRNG